MNRTAKLIEGHFQRVRVPYVCVEECRKAILPEPMDARTRATVDAGPKVFHFVAYGHAENWLVMVGRRDTGNVAAMREWERLFGAGFRAVFARFRTHPEFESVDGAPLSLDTMTTLPDPPQTDRFIDTIERMAEEPHFAALEDGMADAAERRDTNTENRLCTCAQALVRQRLAQEPADSDHRPVAIGEQMQIF